MKRFCRRCKAHSISVAMHTSCPFKFCKCHQCEKITNNNEIAKERARKQRADATAVSLAASSSSQITVEQVLKLGNKNSTEEDRKKHLSPAAVQAGKLQVQFKLICYPIRQNLPGNLNVRQVAFCCFLQLFLGTCIS